MTPYLLKFNLYLSQSVCIITYMTYMKESKPGFTICMFYFYQMNKIGKYIFMYFSKRIFICQLDRYNTLYNVHVYFEKSSLFLLQFIWLDYIKKIFFNRYKLLKLLSWWYPLSSHILTNIFKWFAQFGQLIQALFYNIWCPLVHLIMLVWVSSNGTFYGLKWKFNYYWIFWYGAWYLIKSWLYLFSN